MPQIRLVVEYDGKPFSGWQVQPNVRTVQEELHKALKTVLREDIGLPVASGRTDAGVSARRQVVCFKSDSIDLENLQRVLVGVSSILKNEVAILAIERVPDDFHPIHMAVAKQYSYRVWNHPSPPVLCYGSALHVTGPISMEAMLREASHLIGEHDFSSFRATGCGASSPVRTVTSIDIERDGNVVEFRVVGQGFLKQMVRNIVGTLLEYGKDPERQPSCREVLQAKDRSVAGPTAEPWGLSLDWVEYPEGRL